MFYDLFCELCARKGIAPTRAALDMGMSKATPTTWKNKGTTPQAAQLQKIADYFGASVAYLLGKTKQKEKPLANENGGLKELTEYLDELKNRPEMKMLFSLAKGATKEDVEKAVKIIETLLEK